MPRRILLPLTQTLALGGYVKLMRAAESVTARIHVALTGDLTLTQFAVLEALLHVGPLRHGELAEKILRSSGNLTLVVKNLEKKGWIKREREPDDRRVMTVRLTAPGRQVIEELFPEVAKAIAHEFRVLEKAEQASLGRLCKKLGVGRSARPPA